MLTGSVNLSQGSSVVVHTYIDKEPRWGREKQGVLWNPLWETQPGLLESTF